MYIYIYTGVAGARRLRARRGPEEEGLTIIRIIITIIIITILIIVRMIIQIKVVIWQIR